MPRAISVQRKSIRRPQGGAATFVCPACDYVLWDGVHYSRCPVCDLPVDWVDTSKHVWCCATCDTILNDDHEDGDDWPHCTKCRTPMTQVLATERPSTTPPGRSLVAAGQVAYVVCVLLQLVSLAIDRFAFAMVAPILALFAVAALGFLIVTTVALGDIAALIKNRRTRVIHGLEHATIAVLEQQGARAFQGVTTEGHFWLELANGLHATSASVRSAAESAIQRVLAGERRLAYTRRCGTSLMVALLAASLVIVAGGITGIALGLAGNVIAAFVALAIVVAWLVSRPLGLLAQRCLTVSTDFAVARVGTIVKEVASTGDRTRFSVAITVDEQAASS